MPTAAGRGAAMQRRNHRAGGGRPFQPLAAEAFLNPASAIQAKQLLDAIAICQTAARALEDAADGLPDDAASQKCAAEIQIIVEGLQCAHREGRKHAKSMSRVPYVLEAYDLRRAADREREGVPKEFEGREGLWRLKKFSEEHPRPPPPMKKRKRDEELGMGEEAPEARVDDSEAGAKDILQGRKSDNPAEAEEEGASEQSPFQPQKVQLTPEMQHLISTGRPLDADRNWTKKRFIDAMTSLIGTGMTRQFVDKVLEQSPDGCLVLNGLQYRSPTALYELYKTEGFTGKPPTRDTKWTNATLVDVMSKLEKEPGLSSKAFLKKVIEGETSDYKTSGGIYRMYKKWKESGGILPQGRGRPKGSRSAPREVLEERRRAKAAAAAAAAAAERTTQRREAAWGANVELTGEASYTVRNRKKAGRPKKDAPATWSHISVAADDAYTNNQPAASQGNVPSNETDGLLSTGKPCQLQQAAVTIKVAAQKQPDGKVGIVVVQCPQRPDEALLSKVWPDSIFAGASPFGGGSTLEGTQIVDVNGTAVRDARHAVDLIAAGKEEVQLTMKRCVSRRELQAIPERVRMARKAAEKPKKKRKWPAKTYAAEELEAMLSADAMDAIMSDDFDGCPPEGLPTWTKQTVLAVLTKLIGTGGTKPFVEKVLSRAGGAIVLDNEEFKSPKAVYELYKTEGFSATPPNGDKKWTREALVNMMSKLEKEPGLSSKAFLKKVIEGGEKTSDYKTSNAVYRMYKKWKESGGKLPQGRGRPRVIGQPSLDVIDSAVTAAMEMCEGDASAFDMDTMLGLYAEGMREKAVAEGADPDAANVQMSARTARVSMIAAAMGRADEEQPLNNDAEAPVHGEDNYELHDQEMV